MLLLPCEAGIGGGIGDACAIARLRRLLHVFLRADLLRPVAGGERLERCLLGRVGLVAAAARGPGGTGGEAGEKDKGGPHCTTSSA
ncbi:hypothetical protein [Methylobacterium komagatae]|uniref:hypothetical protein n=1 Tax=Methylobacterium komagatae TaxID=374425 RepID=UPI0036735843